MLSITPLHDKINNYLLNKDNSPFIENGGLSKLLDELFEIIVEVLPHGSGIDASWHLEQLGSLPIVLCSNSFHAMDQNGYYCDWVDFTVKLNLESLDFDVEVNNKQIELISKAYDIEIDNPTEEELEAWEQDNPRPYLDDLDQYIYECVEHSLNLYVARESIRYIKQYYPDILKQELKDFN